MTTNSEPQWQRLGLSRNPFPPATTGSAFVDDLSLPDSWEAELRERVSQLASSDGPKALLIEGGYGSGKTFILNWIQEKVLHEHRIKSYFFENPGVAFYDLANRLMRQVGRYELAKALWEAVYDPDDPTAVQQRLISMVFGQWLKSLGKREDREQAIATLSKGMNDAGLAADEEIQNILARLVVETRDRPYFEYRDFVPRTRNSLVAEREEAQYFRALVRILVQVLDADGVAFLLDEFEDVALARRLTRTQSTAYIATLRRLLDTAESENLWIVLSTTPEGLERTSELDESLVQRFGYRYTIPPLSQAEARRIVECRISSARPSGSEGLMPFAEDALDELEPTSWSSPRRLIKVMWYAVSLAVQRQLAPPLSSGLVKEAEQELYAERSEA